jgi:CDP-glycerol glycerophosphotransferase
MFDRERFLKSPSHIDPFLDLPGEIVSTVDDLVDTTLQLVESGFMVDSEYASRADVLLDHRDTAAADRVYDLVRGARRKVHVWNRLAQSDLGRTAAKMFRSSKAFEPLMMWLFRTARAMPFKREVLFESSLGRQYTGNPKYLYENLVERGEAHHTVWVLGDTTRMKDPASRKVARNTPGFYWHLGRSKTWITDQHFPHGLKPARSTSFIQTWHGTPLKRLFLDQEHIVGQRDDYYERTLRRLKYWDVMLAQSGRAAAFFRSAFQFKGDIEVTGYPRNDILARDDRLQVDAIRTRLGIPEGKQVVLYAPTFRDDARHQAGWAHDMELNLESFGETLGDSHYLLVRTHLFVRRDNRLTGTLEGFGADVSRYSDISELLLIADILVTDYSSVLFDFAVTGRPMIFFAYDLDHYRDDLRGFYLDYEEEMPGPIVRSSDEVIEAIRSVDAWKDEYVESLERFRMEFCPHDDGMASERVIDRLREEGWL